MARGWLLPTCVIFTLLHYLLYLPFLFPLTQSFNSFSVYLPPFHLFTGLFPLKVHFSFHHLILYPQRTTANTSPPPSPPPKPYYTITSPRSPLSPWLLPSLSRPRLQLSLDVGATWRWWRRKTCSDRRQKMALLGGGDGSGRDGEWGRWLIGRRCGFDYFFIIWKARKIVRMKNFK